jgi:REP element-mobilizing transposase RayT
MRRARLTFTGAFHHCMNRGHGRERILSGNKDKAVFLNILSMASKKLKIRVLAYCLMDNHYHLVIENSSGRMADFFKLLNGEYGTDYRRRHGGAGYVFQGRFKSTLIQDDSYLIMAISYVLANPVRARLAEDFLDYPWSSAGEYFKSDLLGRVDHAFVEALYGKRTTLYEQVRSWQGRKSDLPIIHTEMGPVMADETGVGVLKERFERRSGQESLERKRKDDFGFEPIAKIYQEFCAMHEVDLDKIDFDTRHGQQLRRELLLHLKDRGGLKYREIARLPDFAGVKMNSLGSLYRYEKSKTS